MQKYLRRSILRLAAMLLTLTILLTGCTIGSGNSWVYRFGDTTMPAGVYLSCQISAISDAHNVYGDPMINTRDLLKATIEGVPATQWIESRTDAYARMYFLVEQRFDEMSLVYDEVMEAATAYVLENAWAQESGFYIQNNISKESVAIAAMNNTKLQEIFVKTYGEGGEREVSDDELKAAFEENYLYFNAFTVPKFAAAPESTDKSAEELNAEMQALIEEYLTRLEAGEKIEVLAYELDKKQAEIYGEDPEAIEEYPDGVLETFIPPVYRDYYDQELVNAVSAAENNAFGVIEASNIFYIYQKVDIAETGSYDVYRSSVLMELKMSEFNKELLEQAAYLDVEVNKSAVNKYKVSKLDLS